MLIGESTMAKTTNVHESWFEKFKEKVTDLFESFDFSNDNLIKIATYLGVGFGIGFSLKRFGSLVLFGLLLTALALYGLQYLNFIEINIEKIKLFLGFSHKATLYDVTNLYVDWIKNHITLSVSFCIGFFVGYRLG
jgi:uncharacterized membrane protein (Fun14 family)